jgi:hypothetical protein
VRFVFLDEGGISSHEPVAVVAGVVVQADEQLIPLERALERLKRKHIPEEHWDDFVFHAKEIWSGTGKIFGDRDAWTLDRRLFILRDLIRVIKKLDLPVVHEAYSREDLLLDNAPKERPPTERELSVATHSCAFASCTLRIEQYMRQCFPTEVAQVVAEDNDQARKMLKAVHEAFRFPHRAPGIISNNILPFRHIRNSVHFADKKESAPLQLADLCAFIIRGRLSKHPKGDYLYNRLKSMMFKFADADENYRGPLVSVSPPYKSISYDDVDLDLDYRK